MPEQAILKGLRDINDQLPQKIVRHNSVSGMKNDSILSVGHTISTLGYYFANDGGSATYFVRNKLFMDVDDGGSIHILNNNLVAELKIDNDTINVKQFGAVGDRLANDTVSLTNAFSKLGVIAKKLYIPKGKYLLSNPIEIQLKRDVSVYGDGKGDDGSILDYINPSNEYALKLYGVNNFSLENIRILCNGKKGILFGDKDYNTMTYRSGHTLISDVMLFNTTLGISFDCSGGFNVFERVGIDVADNGTAIDIGTGFQNTGYLPNYIFLNSCNLQNSSKVNTTAIKLNAVQYMQIVQCDIAGFNIGLKIENTKEVSNLVVDKNYFFQCKTSVYVNTASSCRNITLRDNNHLFTNGTFLNVQPGTNTVYTFLIDGDFIQGTLQSGYILNNIDITLSNVKSHFVRLNQNSTIGDAVTLKYNSLKPNPTTFSLAAGAGKTVNLDVMVLPVTLSNAVVYCSYPATVTQTQSNGVLAVTVTNNHTASQQFTVFVP